MIRKLSSKRRTFKKSLDRRYKRVKKNTNKRRVSKKIRKNTLKRRVSRNILRRKSFRGGRPDYFPGSPPGDFPIKITDSQTSFNDEEIEILILYYDQLYKEVMAVHPEEIITTSDIATLTDENLEYRIKNRYKIMGCIRAYIFVPLKSYLDRLRVGESIEYTEAINLINKLPSVEIDSENFEKTLESLDKVEEQIGVEKGILETRKRAANQATELLQKTVSLVEKPRNRDFRTLYISQILDIEDEWGDLTTENHITIIIEYYIQVDIRTSIRILFPYITTIKTIIESSSYRGERGCGHGFYAYFNEQAISERKTCRRNRVQQFVNLTFDDRNAEILAQKLYKASALFGSK